MMVAPQRLWSQSTPFTSQHPILGKPTWLKVMNNQVCRTQAHKLPMSFLKFVLLIGSFWLSKVVTSHDTYEPLLINFQPVLDPSNQLCHIHTTSQIPRTKCLHSNSVIINFQPWTLFIVNSCLLFTSDPATMCSLFMYILPWLCSTHTLFIPNLTPITTPFSSTNAIPIDSYIRLLFLYDILMFKYQLWFSCHWLLNPILTPHETSVPDCRKTLVTPEI